jgi:Cys-tRNA(Pro)/Cys-tRNA(Cys) deacylase
MSLAKTNAIRIIEQNDIVYNTYTYDNSDGKIDGMSVATKIGRPIETIYKTLVTIGHSRALYVFIIPVSEELDLKKCAQNAVEKNIELIPVKDITKWTGYIRGGCSPIGMKKNYKTFIDSSVKEIDLIVFSGGKIGIQVELPTDKLIGDIMFSGKKYIV